MAKYGLLVTSPIANTKNIGDYMQSLAAEQFLSDNYCLVEKECISKFTSEEKVKVIMNAWWMWHPENWPPQPCIEPLLISMHLSPLKALDMLSEKGKNYLREYGPVGCRDLDTKHILDDAGIPAYFSGCLTLTLGYKYANKKGERKGVIFVDPYIPSLRYIAEGDSKYYPLNAIKALFYYIKDASKINKLIKHTHYFNGRYKIATFYNASMFYHIYSTKFDDELLFNATYISHMVHVNSEDNNTTLHETAKKLLQRYAHSQFVVTSRIHCALPCTGVETPVIFVLNQEMESKRNLFAAPGRFGGLIDFFRIMECSNGKLSSKDDVLQNVDKISANFIFKNKDNWKAYRDNLIKSCITFLKK